MLRIDQILHFYFDVFDKFVRFFWFYVKKIILCFNKYLQIYTHVKIQLIRHNIHLKKEREKTNKYEQQCDKPALQRNHRFRLFSFFYVCMLVVAKRSAY